MTRQDLVNKSIDKLNTVKEALELINILEYDEFMLSTERRWSEQSVTFTSPENPSMYSSSSCDIIKQRENA